VFVRLLRPLQSFRRGLPDNFQEAVDFCTESRGAEQETTCLDINCRLISTAQASFGDATNRLPDEPVEFQLFLVQILSQRIRRVFDIGGTDRFVRILSIFFER